MESNDQTSPQLYSCPNCNAPIVGGLAACPACGFRLVKRERTAEKVLSIVLLVVIGLPAAFCGTCSVIFSPGDASMLGIGAFAFAIFGVLIWLMVASFKKQN